MTLLAVLIAVALLVLLISALKLHPFIAFLIASMTAAFILGRPLETITASVGKGIGDMLGSVTAILCLGAMFGRLVADSGAAQQIANRLIALSGERMITLALAAAGFVIGIPLFYNVGFVLMVPLIFSIVRQSGLPTIYVAIPMLSGLSIAHGFLPPHPSPAALVGQFHAEMGRTLILGIIVGIPTLLIAGPLFAQTLKGMKATPMASFKTAEADDRPRPGTAISFAVALLPVILLAGATLIKSLSPTKMPAIEFLGDPTVAMLVALILAIGLLGVARGQRLADIGASCADSIKDIAGILLIVAGAGALKQVFVDGAADVALADWLSSLQMSPLILGWSIAMVIRVALGSATVAGLTAAGIVQPLMAAHGVDPSLMVLAIGAGSLMCSHVNDSGFWMFKEYFGLSLKETFLSWSAMETLVGVFGLIFVLLLSLWV